MPTAWNQSLAVNIFAFADVAVKSRVAERPDDHDGRNMYPGREPLIAMTFGFPITRDKLAVEQSVATPSRILSCLEMASSIGDIQQQGHQKKVVQSEIRTCSVKVITVTTKSVLYTQQKLIRL